MKKVTGVAAVAAAILAQTAIAGPVDVEYYGLPAEMNLPFSEAVRVDHMLYLSGQLGYDSETGKLVEGGISAETHKTMKNIKATLEKYGSSMSEVVKCTVFLADMSEWAEMSKVYISYFAENPPARSALGVNGLALGARTEIECMATVD